MRVSLIPSNAWLLNAVSVLMVSSQCTLVLLSMVSVNKCTMYGALNAQYRHTSFHTHTITYCTQTPPCQGKYGTLLWTEAIWISLSTLSTIYKWILVVNIVIMMFITCMVSHTHTYTHNGYVHKYCIVQYTVH